MKKLLVLMLVLGMASAANATVLSWSVDALTLDINETAVVQLVADDATTYNAKWVGYTPASPAIASITKITALPAAGGDAEVKTPAQTDSSGWWTVMAKDFEAPITIASGNQYDVTVKGLAEGTFGLDSDNLGANDVLEVTVVPEPTTVALLGLGGMFMLRRRKK